MLRPPHAVNPALTDSGQSDPQAAREAAFNRASGARCGAPRTRAGAESARARRITRAHTLALATLHRIEVEQLRDQPLIEWFERAGPADVSVSGSTWACRCYGFATCATSPTAAVAQWCAAVLDHPDMTERTAR